MRKFVCLVPVLFVFTPVVLLLVFNCQLLNYFILEYQSTVSGSEFRETVGVLSNYVGVLLVSKSCNVVM